MFQAYIKYLKVILSLITEKNSILMTSNRKNSLKNNRIIDFSEHSRQPDSSRQRKNSVNLSRPSIFDDIQSNLNQNFHGGKNLVYAALDERTTNKLVFLKRLQKLQKEAIKKYYDNQIEECFEFLEKCLTLIEQRKSNHNQYTSNVNYPQHQLYIRYLQAQFNYKLKNYQLSRQYYDKASKIINRLNKIDREKSLEYIISLSALNAFLYQQQGKNSQALKSIEDLEKIYKNKIPLKTIKQLRICEIQCLVGLKENKNAVNLIKNIMMIEETPQESYKLGITAKEQCKLIGILGKCLKIMGKMQQAEKQMEKYIQKLKKLQNDQSFQSKINREETRMIEGSQKNQIVNLMSRSYQNYVELFSEEETIKILYITRRWVADCQQSDQAIIKLFHIYYLIGDFEQALAEYAEVSDSYRRNCEDWEALGEIKLFYGEKQSAQFMFEKAYDTAKGEDKKMLMEIKLLKLGYQFQENKKEKLKTIDRKIKQHGHKPWIKDVFKVYQDFLLYIGETTRLQKLKTIIEEKSIKNSVLITIDQKNIPKQDEFQKTGKFGCEFLNNDSQNLRESQFQQTIKGFVSSKENQKVAKLESTKNPRHANERRYSMILKNIN